MNRRTRLKDAARCTTDPLSSRNVWYPRVTPMMKRVGFFVSNPDGSIPSSKSRRRKCLLLRYGHRAVAATRHSSCAGPSTNSRDRIDFGPPRKAIQYPSSDPQIAHRRLAAASYDRRGSTNRKFGDPSGLVTFTKGTGNPDDDFGRSARWSGISLETDIWV